jgi:hypothetical protein
MGPDVWEWKCEWKLRTIASVVARMEAKAPRRLLGNLYRSNEKTFICE